MSSIFIRTIIIYFILTLVLKIMGKRQIGELEVNELVSTLLISEIAAMPISDNNIPLLSALVPIVFIATLEIFISALKNKWHGLKKVIEGKPVYIIYKGRLNQNILAENRISINEVLTEMRSQGIGNLSDIYYGILEQNGKLSFLKSSDRETVAHTIIIDGVPDYDNLRRLGYNEEWVYKILRSRKISLSDVFLMSITDDNELSIIKKEVKK